MLEQMELIYERINFCFETRKFADLRILLLDMEPADIAIYMESVLDDKERLMFFRLLPKELASSVFVEFDSDTQENQGWIARYSQRFHGRARRLDIYGLKARGHIHQAVFLQLRSERFPRCRGRCGCPSASPDRTAPAENRSASAPRRR